MENEQVPEAEERLRQINKERKVLKKQVADDRTRRLEETAKMRVFRDEKIEKIQERLKKISELIYAYNKLGKCSKINYDVFNKILEEINCPEEDVVVDSEE